MESYIQSVYGQVAKEYEKIRSENAAKHKQIEERIYSHLPEIKEIDDSLQKAGLDVCARVLSRGADAEKAVVDMQKKVDSLNARKKKLLSDAGISATIMDEIFSCARCRDKGHADGKRCQCYYDKLYNILRKMSNVCADNGGSFEKFNVNLYSRDIDGEFGISPYDNAVSILEQAKEYAAGKGPSDNLLLYGSPGLGKTFTSSCIANEFIKKGKTVFYMSAPRLFGLFEDYKFGRDTSDAAKMTIDAVRQAELLIIDDLGTEFRSNYADSILFDIINTRLNEGKKMIISTNLTLMQIEKSYSQRISSRIHGGFYRIVFFGDDIRRK